MGEGTFIGASAEADFSEDNDMSQGLFGLVVCGLYIGMFQECKKPVILSIRVEQSLPECFDLLVIKLS